MFCVIVCVVAVINSLVRVVRVVAVLDSCVCVYVCRYPGKIMVPGVFGLCLLC